MPEGMEMDTSSQPRAMQDLATTPPTPSVPTAKAMPQNAAPIAAPIASQETANSGVMPSAPPANNQNQQKSKDVPEPGQIIGNLLVLISLIFFFWKRHKNNRKISKISKS